LRVAAKSGVGAWTEGGGGDTASRAGRQVEGEGEGTRRLGLRAATGSRAGPQCLLGLKSSSFYSARRRTVFGRRGHSRRLRIVLVLNIQDYRTPDQRPSTMTPIR
jgi:hypothetical protein